MNNFDKPIEEKLMPLAVKLGSNKALLAIRDGVGLSSPFLLIGSLLMLIVSFPLPGWSTWLADIGLATYLWKGVEGSFGLIGLISAFGIAHSYSNQAQVNGVASGLLALASYLLVTPTINVTRLTLLNPDLNLPEGLQVPSGLTASYMGAGGIFTALLIGLVSASIYNGLMKRDIQIKLPDAVPPAVSSSFSELIPGGVIIGMWLLVYGILDANQFPSAHELVKTFLGGVFGLIGDNLLGTLLIVSFNSIFWFFGIHGGNTFNILLSPSWVDNLNTNVTAYRAGEPLTEIFTGPFMENFVWIGGSGATLGLVIALVLSARRRNSSQYNKELAPTTLLPALFNINEPVMFGVPVVLNVTLFIPFLLVPMVNVIVSWAAMASGLVPLTRMAVAWTMPPIISGFLTTGSIRGAILQVVLILIDVMIYLPFFILVEKQMKAKEKERD